MFRGKNASYVHRWFTDAEARRLYPEADHDTQSRRFVADLRAAVARRDAKDLQARTLIDDLNTHSPEFAALWAEHEVAVRRDDRKRINHPALGILEVNCLSLLSEDVVFKNLGLVIVDEEQRFGVKHKERLKERFRLVDVLTLSATPIPRTLYLALMGARDMSLIETPPPNRQPVETVICAYDERVIRDAVQREVQRGGQTHGFLQTLLRQPGAVGTSVRMNDDRPDERHGMVDKLGGQIGSRRSMGEECW